MPVPGGKYQRGRQMGPNPLGWQPTFVNDQDWNLANTEMLAGGERADNMRRFLAAIAGLTPPTNEWPEPTPMATRPAVPPSLQMGPNPSMMSQAMPTIPSSSRPATAPVGGGNPMQMMGPSPTQAAIKRKMGRPIGRPVPPRPTPNTIDPLTAYIGGTMGG